MILSLLGRNNYFSYLFIEIMILSLLDRNNYFSYS